jgi:hypothetical protein
MRRFILASLLLVALVFVGCEKQKSDPYYVLWITATVVDEAGVPIEGIYLHPEDAEFVGRTGYTDYKGEVGARSYTEPRDRWIICVEDVDGEYNRGEYESSEIDITDRVMAAHDPDEWGFSGSGFVEIGVITLRLKK